MTGWTAVPLMLLVSIGMASSKMRIPMGTSANCDNAKTGTEIDWDDKRDRTPYTCPAGYEGRLPTKSSILEPGKSEADVLAPFKNTPPQTQGPFPYPCPPAGDGTQQRTYVLMKNLEFHGKKHVCLNESVSYPTPWPTSGNHRPAWPRYGSYKYLPPQRYLHNLEHGAIVALYNPCVSKFEVRKLKTILACTIAAIDKTKPGPSNAYFPALRFVISPEMKAPPCLPFVFLAWQQRLMMADLDSRVLKDFIKAHYGKGPEKNEKDGQYEVGLLDSYRDVVQDTAKDCHIYQQ